MSETFSVKNFEKFQHYKDRSPPWIRLYNALLDDYDFGLLPDASKAHLIAIWLLASRYDNKIPLDPEWVSRRINATEPVNLDLLIKSGFLLTDQPCIKVLAERKQVAMPEESRGEQSRAETVSLRSTVVRERQREFDEEFWPLWPNHVAKKPAIKAFHSARKRESLETILDGVRRYARTKPDGVNWMHAATFLNADRWTDEPASETPNTQRDGGHDRILRALASVSEKRAAARGRPMDSERGIDAGPEDGPDQSGRILELAAVRAAER